MSLFLKGNLSKYKTQLNCPCFSVMYNICYCRKNITFGVSKEAGIIFFFSFSANFDLFSAILAVFSSMGFAAFALCAFAAAAAALVAVVTVVAAAVACCCCSFCSFSSFFCSIRQLFLSGMTALASASALNKWRVLS